MHFSYWRKNLVKWYKPNVFLFRTICNWIWPYESSKRSRSLVVGVWQNKTQIDLRFNGFSHPDASMSQTAFLKEVLIGYYFLLLGKESITILSNLLLRVSTGNARLKSFESENMIFRKWSVGRMCEQNISKTKTRGKLKLDI